MAVLYAKLIGVIVQHWILLTTWNDGHRSLRKAAAVLQAGSFFSARFWTTSTASGTCSVDSSYHRNRRPRHPPQKHPSLFQLLENPELLEYTVP